MKSIITLVFIGSMLLFGMIFFFAGDKELSTHLLLLAIFNLILFDKNRGDR
jgi:hypothetical protein